MFNRIVTIAYLLIGIYCIYAGVTKPKKLFENSMVKADMTDIFKVNMFRLLVVCGPLLLAGALCELLGVNPWVYLVCYTVAVVLAGWFIFKLRKCLKKEL